MNDRLRLAELLTIRLCHDLSGPIGTLMGSLQMVNEDPDDAADALALATEMSGGLVRRLRFLRAAWGGSTTALRTDELRTLAEGLPLGRRLAVEFDGVRADGQFSAATARVMLNVLLLAVESLPMGGTVTVAGNPAADVVVRLAGPRAAWPDGFAASMADAEHAWAALSSESPTASRVMQGPLTALVARTAGVRLGFLMGARQEEAPPLIISAAA